jgi:hypothetical protein
MSQSPSSLIPPRHALADSSGASLDSFEIPEILRLPAELLEFANWAFGPNSLKF